MKVLVNPKYGLNYSILVYSPLPSATRVVYPRIKYTNQVYGNILRDSNTVVCVDYQCYKKIISAIRRYIIRDSRNSLTIFIDKWNYIIGTYIILPQLVTGEVYPNSKYTNQVCSDILKMIDTVFC